MKYYIKILITLILVCCFFLSCSSRKYRSNGLDNLARSSGFTAYKVQPGDSLLKIAKKFQVDPSVITVTNHLHNPKNLRVGVWLRIPNTSADFAKNFSSTDFNFEKAEFNHASHGEHSLNKIKRNNTQLGATSNRILVRKPKAVKKKKAARIGWPIRTGKYTSGFGQRGKKFHHGIDISAKRGTPIYSAHNGVVAYSGSGLRGFGRTVIVKGEKGLYTLYAHANKLYVKKGQRVTRGQKIASVGSTGRSSGSHLHFEVRTKDNLGRYVVVDPVPLLNRYAKKKPRFKVNSKLNDILARADSHQHIH